MGVLRVWLAVIVLVCHTPGQQIIGDLLIGMLAVHCFYVISGFYIYYVIRQKYQFNTHFVRSFYASRALRIFPTYVLILTLSIVFVGINHPPLNTLATLQYWFTNLFILGKDILRFTMYNPSTNGFNWLFEWSQTPKSLWGTRFDLIGGQAWTVAIELYFYLLAPFILLKSRNFLFGLMAISITIRMLLYANGYGHGTSWFNGFFPSELATFLFGALSCSYYLQYKNTIFDNINNSPRLNAVLYFAILAIIVMLTVAVRNHLSIIAYGLIAGFIASIIPLLFRVSSGYKWDRYIGNLSYPIYLNHILLISCVELWLPDNLIDPNYMIITILSLSITLAILSYHLLENPIDRFRHRKFTAL